jgi:hypothetical protein
MGSLNKTWRAALLHWNNAASNSPMLCSARLSSDHYSLNFIQRNGVAGAIIELGGARLSWLAMVCDYLYQTRFGAFFAYSYVGGGR